MGNITIVGKILIIILLLGAGGNAQVASVEAMLSARADADKYAQPIQSENRAILWIEHDVPTDANFSPSVISVADMNGDGHLDFLASSIGDDLTTWYENDGNNTFSEHIIDDEKGATSMQPVDLEGDGDVDLVFTALNTVEICWYENDGAFNFTKHRVNAVPKFQPVFVAAADLDGDGDIDVVGCSNGDDKIHWYENDGAQNFTDRLIVDNSNGANKAYPVDFDGDGDIDLLASYSTADAPAWYENNGSAIFTEHTINASIEYGVNHPPVDLDGDGDFDLLLNSSLGNIVKWLENDGSQNFSDRLVTDSVDSPTGLAVADFDADGDNDIAVGADAQIFLYENDGSENFSKGSLTMMQDANDLIAADIDGDGDSDLLAAAGFHNELKWFENSSPQSAAIEIAIDSLYLPVPADGDTFPYNLTLTNLTESQLIQDIWIDMRLPNGATVAVLNPRTLALPPFAVLNRSPVMRVSNAGPSGEYAVIGHTGTYPGTVVDSAVIIFTKLAVAESRLDKESLEGIPTHYALKQNYPNPFNPVTLTLRSSGAELTFQQHVIDLDAFHTASLIVNDLDDDGDADVLAAIFVDDEVVWYENDGAENFTKHIINPDAWGAGAVIAIDLDEDGDKDVLSADHHDNNIIWYENDGAQNFTAFEIAGSASTPRDVCAADLDGDLDLDVVIPKHHANEVTWYENDGEENFSANSITTIIDNPTDIHTADVDGDGDIDVLSSSSDDHRIVWYENDGAGSFTRHIISDNAVQAWYVYSEDLDSDGDIDVLSASMGDNKIAWYENDGDQRFTEHIIAILGVDPVEVQAVDFDADGDVDVLSAATEIGGGKFSWFENDGAENFTEHVFPFATVGPSTIFAADIDGDGDLDAVAADDFKVVWYENIATPTAAVEIGLAIDSLYLPVPAAGDTFPYELTLTNLSSAQLSQDIWIDLHPPGGVPVVVLSPRAPVLPPLGILNRSPIMRVSAGGPAGEYSIIAYAGIAPDMVLASDTIIFTKQAAAPSLKALEALPERYVLEQNYPNPFNPATLIRYALPQDSKVTLKVYDMLGQEVATLVAGVQNAGFYAAPWDGKNDRGQAVSSGIYIYRMMASDVSGQEATHVRENKMLLVR